MQLRSLLSVLLVIGLVLPVAGASATPASTPIATAASTANGGGGSSTAAGDGNYTRLYVDDRYRHLRLKPGESETVTVTVENGEDEAVEVSPHLVKPQLGDRPVTDDWVTVDSTETSIEPGEEREVTVTISVPEDAELGRYSGWMAFTDETITYPGRPAQPVHAATINVEVWREPTVRVDAGRHVYRQVEVGESFTHEIVVENTGDEAVPVRPELAGDRGRCVGNCPAQLERSWLEFDAPAEIGPGETATVEVTVTPPADAERGRYDAEVTLGLQDPARNDRNTYWQRVDLNFQVWEQPDEPFETTFEVSEATTDVSVTLSPRTTRLGAAASDDDSDPVSFDVEFVTPSGETVDAERVRVTDRGFVDLSAERPQSSDGDYGVSGGEQEFVYRVDEPAAGSWTMRVMPHNTVGFGYEVTRNES